ncbi:MAG: iron donor protein CyaY [Ectothiorhodospiraceae bacterium]|jgi:CyaY protein|nr:iron donor protein CyaY [Ectothiorhodospiraceae bacterium]
MNSPSFSVVAQQALESLMERLGEIDALADADLDLVDGVLTLTFDDGAKLIINRQEPLSQLWLASPEGPAHFARDDDDWCDVRSGESLTDALNRILSSKLGEVVRI